MGRTLNPNSLIGNDTNWLVCASKTMILVTAQIHFVIAPVDCEGLREFSEAGRKPVEIMNFAPLFHHRNSPSRLQRSNDNKTVLLSLHYNIQHPVHAVIEI